VNKTGWKRAGAATLASALLGIVLGACGSDGTGPQAPVPASVTVTAPSTTVPVGGTLQLTATVRDQAGNTMAGQPVMWSTADQAIASVSSTGLVTAAGAGTVRITASLGGRSGFLDLDVRSADCTGAPVGNVALGQTVSGALSGADCVLPDGTFADAWLLVLDAPGILEIELTSTQFDAYLILTDEDLDIITEDDDGGGGSNALIWRPLPAGRYLVWANSWGPGETGSYQLAVRRGEPCALTGSLGVGQAVAGTLDEAGCTAGPDRYADWWQLDVESGATVAIDLMSTSFDAYMYLLDADLSYLAEDDDGGSGLDSRITMDLRAGTYYVLVTSYDARESGPYTLSAQPAAAGAITADAAEATRAAAPATAAPATAEWRTPSGREIGKREVTPLRPPKR
jgi:hypothetical protein